MQLPQISQLKSKLEKLGYHEELKGGDEGSLLLVARLLDDLIQTSESCRRLKLQSEQQFQQSSQSSSQIDSLKSECNRLVMENNQLHVLLIKASDQRDELTKKSQLSQRKLENEIAELKFQNKQLLGRFESGQRKGESERLRLEKLLGIIGHSATREINAEYIKQNSAKFGSLAEKVIIETGLAELKPSEILQSAPVSLVSVDMMKLMEMKVDSFQKKLKDAEAQEKALQDQIDILNSQISTRDAEIVRLGKLLEVEKSNYAGERKTATEDEATFTSKDKIGSNAKVGQIESQLAFLHECIADLEKSKSVLEREKASIQSESNRKISQLTDELEKLRSSNGKLDEELKYAQSLVTKLEKQHGMAAAPSKLKKPSKPEASTSDKIKNVKNDKLYDEVVKLRRDLNEKNRLAEELAERNDSLEKSEKKLQNEISNLKDELLSTNKKLVEAQHEIQNIIRSHPYISTDVKVDTLTSNKNVELDDTGRDTKSELERQIHNLKRKLESSRQLEEELQKARETITKLENTIDNLRSRVNDLEYDNKELMQKESIANSRKDKVENELADARSKIAALKEEVEKQKSSFKEASLAVDRINAEKEAVVKLYTQLNQEQQNRMEEEARLQERVESGDLQESDLHSLRLELIRCNETNGKLSEQLASVTSQISEFKNAQEQPFLDEIDSLKANAEKLNSQLESSEGKCEELLASLRDAESQKTDLENEISRLLEKLESQEKQICSLQVDIAERKPSQDQTNSIRQRHLLEEFDKERDAWQYEIDEKTEAIAQLQTEILSARQKIEKANAAVESQTNEISVLKNQVIEQVREISSVSAQLDDALEQKHALEEEVSKLLETNKNLQSNISTLIHESDILHQEFRNNSTEKQQLQDTLEKQSQQIAHYEQIFQRKEDDRDQLMTSYRKLVQDHNQLENQFANLKAHLVTMEKELMEKEQSISQVRNGAENKISEIERLNQELAEYKIKSISLRDANISLEALIGQRDSELAKRESELATIRHLMQNLQSSKENLAQVHMDTSRALENAQLASMAIEKEKMALETQVKSMNIKISDLERLLSHERVQNIKAKGSLKEAWSNTSEMEGKIEEWDQKDHQRSNALENARQKLRNLESENHLLRERISYLERAVSDLTESLKQADDDRMRLRQIVNNASVMNERPVNISFESHEGKTEVEIRRAIQEDIFSSSPARPDIPKTPESQSLSSPSLLEQKVIDELESTKKQLKRFEELIDKRSKTFLPKPQSMTIQPANEAEVAKDLLDKWKTQNEAMREVILSIVQDQEPPEMTATPAPIFSQPPKPVIRKQISRNLSPRRIDKSHTSTTADLQTIQDEDDELRRSLDASERRRKLLELENQKILSVVQQVRDDLQLAKSLGTSSPL